MLPFILGLCFWIYPLPNGTLQAAPVMPGWGGGGVVACVRPYTLERGPYGFWSAEQKTNTGPDPSRGTIVPDFDRMGGRS